MAFDHAGVARNAVEQHIRPGYKRLADATAALNESLKAFCADQQEASLAAAKQAYADAVTAWGRIEHLRFGPIMEDHRYERIVFWPDPKGIGSTQVSRAMSKNDPTLISPESLGKKSVALQGLTALEQVLYGRTGLLGQKTGFRCQYAMAIGANLAAIAAAVDSAWNAPDGYCRLMLNPGADNPVYMQPGEVTQELVMAYATGLLSVRNLKIGAPLGLVQSSKVSSAAFAASGRKAWRKPSRTHARRASAGRPQRVCASHSSSVIVVREKSRLSVLIVTGTPARTYSATGCAS